MLRFAISSSRVVSNESEKKYVLYTISIINENTDLEITKPSVIDRRYTDFSNLYNNLRKEHPTLLNGVYFPKKVVMGNFDPELISSRSSSFTSLLIAIAKDTKLRDSIHTVDFFQGLELTNAKQQIAENKYDQAMYLLENNFRLLNKLYTDRSHVVLIALCRLVACGAGGAGTDPVRSAALAGPVERWASLAIRRFQAVSDTELLTLYVPLIKACISIWKVLGKDCEAMQSDLERMKKRGMKVDACPELSQAIQQLEGLTGS